MRQPGVRGSREKIHSGPNPVMCPEARWTFGFFPWRAALRADYG
ncbi:MAG: hypothetical protein WD355_02870 [Balneolaceae bacterium]